MAIDTARITAELAVRAEVGLRRAAEFALGRAQHHAPVRAIFDRRRSPRGPAFRNKGPIRSAQAYRKFLASKSRARRVDLASAPRGAESLVSLGLGQQTGGSTAPGRSSTLIAADSGRTSKKSGKFIPGRPLSRSSRRLGRATSFAGHANSLVPVFRQGKSRVTGDFRRIGRAGPSVTQQGSSRPSIVSAGRSEQIRRSFLTSRGRFEVGSKRASFQGRIGGRLRGELHLTPPRWRGRTLWIYVRSTVPYAGYQEFGTSRHRAQPFMRPALYESRTILRSEVAKAVKRPTRGASSGVTPGRSGPGVG